MAPSATPAQGLDTQGDAPSAISAGYSGTGVDDNVTVNSDATIVAAAGAGINAYNFGIGDVTVTTGTDLGRYHGSRATASRPARKAVATSASPMTERQSAGHLRTLRSTAAPSASPTTGTVSGSTGLFATDQSGDISITNGGHITGGIGAGVEIDQNGTGERDWLQQDHQHTGTMLDLDIL